MPTSVKTKEDLEFRRCWEQIWLFARGPEKQQSEKEQDVRRQLAKNVDDRALMSKKPEDETTAIGYWATLNEEAPTHVKRFTKSQNSEAADMAAAVVLRALKEAVQVGDRGCIARLLLDAEEVSPKGAERSALAALLMSQAKAMVAEDYPSSEPLWAAIRHYALLLPVQPSQTQVEALLEFLESREIKTQQVALQALANVFAGRPPSAELDLARTKATVSAFVRSRAGKVQSPAELALVMVGFHAAAAVGAEDLNELTQALISMDEGALLSWQMLFDLVPMAHQWRLNAPEDVRTTALVKVVGRLSNWVKENPTADNRRGT